MIFNILFVLVLLSGLLAVGLGIGFGSPSHWFSSVLTDAEFDAMMDLIFEDPNGEYDRWNMKGGGYTAWHISGPAFFKVNEEAHFSIAQRMRFYNRMQAWVKENSIQEKAVQDRLNTKKLGELAFKKQLESKLDRV